MSPNKVSIIIPTYNRADFISHTLDSILGQTYENWECLVIDDGSNDNTKEIFEEYIKKDARIRFLHRPDDLPKGANACRNYGFEQSDGEFVNWFDSDDLMMPQKLELQLKSLKTKESAPFCVCQSIWFDKDNNKSLGLRSKSVHSENRFEDYILQNIVWLTTAPLWRRQFITDNRLSFDESLHQSQEYDFHIKALSINEQYTVIETPLVKLIKHSGAISASLYNDDEKIRSNQKVKAKIFEKYASQLSQSTISKLYELETIMLKKLLILKKYKLAKYLLKCQFSHLKYVEAPIQEKISFRLKLVAIYLSFLCTGKGYNILKPLRVY